MMAQAYSFVDFYNYFNVSNPQLNRVYLISEVCVDVVWVPNLGSFDIIDKPFRIMRRNHHAFLAHLSRRLTR